MKQYNVQLHLIMGYYDEEYNEPKIQIQEYRIEAESEEDAIRKAKQLDRSKLSVYDSQADEVNE